MLNLLSNLKIFYLLLIILIMVIINIILNKSKINSNYKYLINGISLILISLITSYYNDIINAIFNFKYLLIIIIATYLVIISIIYIIKIISKKRKTTEELISETMEEKNNYIKKVPVKRVATIEGILSKEELLSITNKELFSINGVECSIIFEDSIPDNIVKNYHILINDINAKLVNGYTLEENKLLKSICTKLETNNLNNIDINNLSILNKISVEEYNFLKQIGLE